MRNLIFIACLCILHRDGFSVVIYRNVGDSTVLTGSFTGSNQSENFNFSSGAQVYTTHEGLYHESEFKRMPGDEMEYFNGNANQSFIDYDNVTSGLLMAQYERCLHSKAFLDCLKFKSLNFVKDLFEPITRNISEVMKSAVHEPSLIKLPDGRRESVLVETMQRALGSSSLEIFQFILEQLDHFLSRHGFLITVKNVREVDSPWLIDSEEERRTGRKVKKKEYAIIFPMLVLFKFLKIKMLLVPILLGVVFLKKLLILTLTLLPYLIGLFGCCRRPPFLGQIQSAGLLQEVDTRGEFSSNLGYSFPDRHSFSYRHRDKGRPSESYDY